MIPHPGVAARNHPPRAGSEGETDKCRRRGPEYSGFGGAGQCSSKVAGSLPIVHFPSMYSCHRSLWLMWHIGWIASRPVLPMLDSR